MSLKPVECIAGAFSILIDNSGGKKFLLGPNRESENMPNLIQICMNSEPRSTFLDHVRKKTHVSLLSYIDLFYHPWEDSLVVQVFLKKNQNERWSKGAEGCFRLLPFLKWKILKVGFPAIYEAVERY